MATTPFSKVILAMVLQLSLPLAFFVPRRGGDYKHLVVHSIPHGNQRGPLGHAPCTEPSYKLSDLPAKQTAFSSDMYAEYCATLHHRWGHWITVPSTYVLP